jgi:hypothetical protein
MGLSRRFFDPSFLYGGGRGGQIGIPACPASAGQLDIGFNAVAEGLREAGLGQQVVAPANGLVEVSGLGPAIGGAEAVRPGLFVETCGKAAFAQALLDLCRLGEQGGCRLVAVLSAQKLSIQEQT